MLLTGKLRTPEAVLDLLDVTQRWSGVALAALVGLAALGFTRAVRDDLSSAYRLHADIARAIEGGNADAARVSMKRHMKVSLENLESL